MVEDFILLELEFELSLLFLMNDGRVKWACRLSSNITLASERVGGREIVTTRETLIEPVSLPGRFVWSHQGLGVFPLDQLLGCFCKIFTLFQPPPPSVGDFAQPRGLLNTDLRFFYCFLLRVPWFSRVTYILHYPVEQTQIDAQSYPSCPLFLYSWTILFYYF